MTWITHRLNILELSYIADICNIDLYSHNIKHIAKKANAEFVMYLFAHPQKYLFFCHIIFCVSPYSSAQKQADCSHLKFGADICS